MPSRTDLDSGLLPEQDSNFIAFTQICAEKGILGRPDGLGEDDCAHGLSDTATLLRFLTARQYNPNAAFDQLQQAMKFRQEKQVLGLYDAIEISDFEQARQFYPHWTGRRDKQGFPICMFDLAKLDKAGLASWETTRISVGWSDAESGKPDMLQMASVFHDGFVRFVLPLCTMMTDRPNPSTAITSSVYLVDASSLGLKQGWSLKMFVQEISWLLSTCYPETITRVFVCNAPSYFTTIWKYLKTWVDPNTAEKVVVLTSAEVMSTLENHIDSVNIPTALGGEHDFKHGMLPSLDDNLRAFFQWTSPEISLPPGPIKFSEEPNGTIRAIGVGSLEGMKRRDVIFFTRMSTIE
ncbi:hypothetical protein N7532_007276 [Penicillium argentinense]|uniref:CRAL-TRIO domain-containing protein n=1 Tax=Penicillium argentinense TaxID=1131581 RepID=A0A9W9F7E6_9EURO|nr:uncharacterized protein N7532_007276 [Penicillium argentinense]KAJ5094985.1 hypothetical protein N7532_007276 [Penicillium argentinense]